MTLERLHITLDKASLAKVYRIAKGIDPANPNVSQSIRLMIRAYEGKQLD